MTVASRMCRDGGQRLLNKSAFSAASDMLMAVERHQSERCVPCCSRSEKVRYLRLRDPSLPPSASCRNSPPHFQCSTFSENVLKTPYFPTREARTKRVPPTLAIERRPQRCLGRSARSSSCGRRHVHDQLGLLKRTVCPLSWSPLRDLNFNSLAVFPRAVQALPKLKEL